MKGLGIERSREKSKKILKNRNCSIKEDVIEERRYIRRYQILPRFFLHKVLKKFVKKFVNHEAVNDNLTVCFDPGFYP